MKLGIVNQDELVCVYMRCGLEEEMSIVDAIGDALVNAS